MIELERVTLELNETSSPPFSPIANLYFNGEGDDVECAVSISGWKGKKKVFAISGRPAADIGAFDLKGVTKQAHLHCKESVQEHVDDIATGKISLTVAVAAEYVDAQGEDVEIAAAFVPGPLSDEKYGPDGNEENRVIHITMARKPKKARKSNLDKMLSSLEQGSAQ